jgi:hypothetical protein
VTRAPCVERGGGGHCRHSALHTSFEKAAPRETGDEAPVIGAAVEKARTDQHVAEAHHPTDVEQRQSQLCFVLHLDPDGVVIQVDVYALRRDVQRVGQLDHATVSRPLYQERITLATSDGHVRVPGRQGASTRPGMSSADSGGLVSARGERRSETSAESRACRLSNCLTQVRTEPNLATRARSAVGDRTRWDVPVSPVSPVISISGLRW